MKFLWCATAFIGFAFLGWALRLGLIKAQSILHDNADSHFGWRILFKSAANPTMFLCLFIGALLALDIAISKQSPIKEYIPLMYKIFGIIFFAWVCLVDITSYEKRYIKLKDRNAPIGTFNHKTADVLLKILKALICIIAILLVMDSAGVPISGIVTIAGIGGASIAFACKDLLTNFVATISLYMEKPFSLGHKIKLPNGREGEVEYIGWRMTKLRTEDKTTLYVTNATFLHNPIENLSQITHKRINQVIGIPYADINKLEAITKEIEDFLYKHNKIDSKEKIRVALSELTASAIQFKMSACTLTTSTSEFLKIQQEIMLHSLKIIEQHGSRIAFSIIAFPISEIEDKPAQ